MSEGEKFYRLAVEAGRIGTWDLDLQTEECLISPKMAELMDFSADQTTVPGPQWREAIVSEDRSSMASALAASINSDAHFDLQFRIALKDGTQRWLYSRGAVSRDTSGKALRMYGASIDVTESKRHEEQLGYQAHLLENVQDAVIATDEQFILTAWNKGAEDMFGWRADEVLGRAIYEVVRSDFSEEQLAQVRREISESGQRRSDAVRVHKDGTPIYAEALTIALRREQGEISGYLSIMRDLTERKESERLRRSEARLRYQALHDLLTDLPNRRLFLDRLGHALVRTRRRAGSTVAVLFMDLDDFKVVNDSLGHEAGDRMLVAVGERLEGCLRPEDTLARFGGDEFAVLVENVEGPEQAIRLTERLTDGLEGPVVLEGRELFVRASVGIALGSARTKSAGDLIRDADAAMYRAKDEGSGYAVFDPALYERAVRRLRLESDLRRAVERDEFVLHYQPIYELGSGGVWGVEALVRWRHPKRGLLGPSEFIALAEDTGLIVPMGRWVLEEACLRTKGWQQSSPHNTPLRVIVNFSVNQLRHPGCVGTLEEVLRRAGLGAGSLTLDVTERGFIDASEANTLALRRIVDLGVGLSIDDFGTGYSSLSHLKRLPAEVLKIDRSFVGGIGENDEDTAIVRMVIDLAHTLGIKVVAEGVESEGQAALLEQMGCDMAQGSHFARPLPPEAVPEVLSAG